MTRFLSLSILLFAIASTQALAQKVPGYLGKRFSVEYNAFMFPAHANPNSSELDTEGRVYLLADRWSINLQHNVIAQWCVSKRASITGGIHYVNTNFIPSVYNETDATLTKYPSMEVYGLNFGLRLFNQHFAPLGHFMEFQLGATMVSTSDYSYYYFDDDSSGPSKNIYMTIPGSSITRPSMGFAIGSNRIINDKFLVSYGLNSTVFIGGYGNRIYRTTKSHREDEVVYRSSNSNEEYLVNMAAGRYSVQAIFNIRLGIGILL